MKSLVPAVLLSMVLIGCTEAEKPAVKPASVNAPTADVAAGKVIADRDCKACHRLDGGSAAPAIPMLASQREAYLLGSLQAYKAGKRVHAALRDLTGHMNDTDLRNVSAYFANLPPVQREVGKDGQLISPYEQGKTLAEACAACHGANGNSTTPGTPSLAGQQPRYLVVSTQEYLHGERSKAPMHGKLSAMSRTDIENVALYFASQTPAQRPVPAAGDPAAGEPLSAVCGGCHGSHGVSTDSATPSLAGQDQQYLKNAIAAYRTTRKREKMRDYVNTLSDKEIENIAAFYTVQKSRPAEKGQGFAKDLAAKCDRCHGAAAGTDLAIPKINGQDKDYLVMALRAYRDDRREVSAMHRMSLPYSDSIIESISLYYANKPAK